jgi:hypothetical protein
MLSDTAPFATDEQTPYDAPPLNSGRCSGGPENGLYRIEDTVRPSIAAIFLGAFLALTLFGPTEAGPLEDGLAAYQRGDFGVAMELWRPLANQGNDRAQAMLGEMYAQGQGVHIGLHYKPFLPILSVRRKTKSITYDPKKSQNPPFPQRIRDVGLTA